MEATLRDLATILEYPTARVAPLAADLARQTEHASLSDALRALSEYVGEDLHRCEEHYTQLFDMQPRCTMHIGYHIFGEDYLRGLMLANLRGELRENGVDCSNDLPDFLPVLLRLLAAFEDEYDRGALTHALLLPGLLKMNEELSDASTPYAAILRALPEVLARVPKVELPEAPAPQPQEARA